MLKIRDDLTRRLEEPVERNTDKHVDSVIELYREREKFGFDKYKTTTERQDLSSLEWMVHLQEELMDATIYLQRLIHDMKIAEEMFKGIKLLQK